MDNSFYTSRGIPPPMAGPIPLRGLSPASDPRYGYRDRYVHICDYFIESGGICKEGHYKDFLLSAVAYLLSSSCIRIVWICHAFHSFNFSWLSFPAEYDSLCSVFLLKYPFSYGGYGGRFGGPMRGGAGYPRPAPYDRPYYERDRYSRYEPEYDEFEYDAAAKVFMRGKPYICCFTNVRWSLKCTLWDPILSVLYTQENEVGIIFQFLPGLLGHIV